MNKTWRYGNCNKKEGLQYHLFYITIAGINCYLPISNSMRALKSAALGSAICKMIRPSASKAGSILFPSIKNAANGWKIWKRSGLGVVYLPVNTSHYIGSTQLASVIHTTNLMECYFTGKCNKLVFCNWNGPKNQTILFLFHISFLVRFFSETKDRILWSVVSCLSQLFCLSDLEWQFVIVLIRNEIVIVCGVL